MTNSQRLAALRERLCGWLHHQSEPNQSPDESVEIIGESVLIVDGFYCGRRFNAGRYYAIWFMEEDELKIHAAGGELLGVFAGDKFTAVNQSEAPDTERALEEQESDSETPDVIALPDLNVDESNGDIRRAA